ncbi:hypothetical protein PHYC_01165 [Phycisphaerales bacterium]|nr:hypothetical protein PHYC_01165 [Phycisphaerales bacterium]
MNGPNSHAGFRWTTLVGAALRVYLDGRIRRLSDRRHWQTNAAGIQLSQLRTLLHAAQGTVFGKAHDFPRLCSLPNEDLLGAYRKAVPVADWYAFRANIQRMREGAEPDVLWPGLVMDFAQTSGTTAGDKYIPVSKEMLRSNFLASLDIFANLSRLGVSLPRLLTGKTLFLGGSTDLSTGPGGVRTGDLSGIVTPLIRWPITEIYLPGRDIALMSRWPDKIEAMARQCLSQDVRMVTGMCSWALVLFERVMQLARETNPGARVITDVWPNFRVFVHGGVKYAPFDPRVRAAYSGSPDGPDIPTRLELYPASEGFVAMQDTPRDPGLRLLTDHFNFYEFVPLESIDQPNPPAFACHEVEKGQRYVVTMSTCAGLWRYVLGDVVEFDTIPDKPHSMGGGGGDGPPRLRIVGRHRQFVNAFGENLIVEHIENAVASAAAATGVVVGEFTAAPVYPGVGVRAGLELAVELQNPEPSPDLLARFAAAVDESLKEQNADYTTKRTDGLGMSAPTVTPLPSGTFHRWLESRGKLGGQHKCPRCANNREIIDQVKSVGSPVGI